MCKICKIIISLIPLIFFTVNTHAGILIEPYVGYSIGAGESAQSGTNYDHSYSTLTYGGRLGGSFLGLMAGLDYSLQSFQMESRKITATCKDNIDRNAMGVFIGYRFPLFLRVWGTYFFNSEAKGTDADVPSSATQLISSDEKFKSGKGTGLGVGFNFLPFIGINLEYRSITYDSLENKGTAVASTVYTKKLKINDYFLSVSLPFNLF